MEIRPHKSRPGNINVVVTEGTRDEFIAAHSGMDIHQIHVYSKDPELRSLLPMICESPKFQRWFASLDFDAISISSISVLEVVLPKTQHPRSLGSFCSTSLLLMSRRTRSSLPWCSSAALLSLSR